MQMLFIDESGTPLTPSKADNFPFFVLGGIIISDKDWHHIKADLENVKKKYKVLGEIKWRFFGFYSRSSSTFSHLVDEQEREALRSELYAILNKYESIKAISTIVHASKAYSMPDIKNPDDLYFYAYKVMAEQFQSYLEDISSKGEPTNGIIICDHRAPKQDQRLQELHAQLLQDGGDTDLNYANLVEGVFLAPSHLSVGIQFADMAAGAVLRLCKGDDRFYNQIKRIFIKVEKRPN